MGVAALAVALVCSGSQAALAQEAPAPAPAAVPSEPEAEQALDRAQEIVDGQAGRPDRELTVVLRELAVNLPALEGQERREARALLARPTQGSADPEGDGYSPGAGPSRRECSLDFCVHWVSQGEDAPNPADEDLDTVPDYVERVLESAEQSRQVEQDQLGWRAPPSDGLRGDGPETDIYLKELSNQGVYGYAAPEGATSRRQYYSYLVLDDDYAEQEVYASDPSQPYDPNEPLRVTMAHEYNHVLQFGYDALQDVWMFESTATWVEERVYPELNDYLSFVSAFARHPGVPITAPDGASGFKIYGSAMWNHFLAARSEPQVVRDAWNLSPQSNPKDFAVGAFGLALQGRGSGFSSEFGRFAAATAEWRSPASGFPDSAELPDVARGGSLSIGGSGSDFRLDHTAYRLFSVPVRAVGAARLQVTAAPKTRAAIALVGRVGDPTTGSVVRAFKYLPDGGRATVSLPNPGRFSRLTAVIVNADGRVSGWGGDDWSYRHDRRPFSARVTR